MIICTDAQREQRIFDWVQTLLNIEEEDLKIISVKPTEYGFYIMYKTYQYGEWDRLDMKLYLGQILLMESLRKN